MSAPCFVTCRRCGFAIPAGWGWVAPHVCEQERIERVVADQFEQAKSAACAVFAKCGPGEVDANGAPL